MSEDVIGQAGQELARAWRAGLQVGEYMARRRQRALEAAQRDSAQAERRARDLIEGERRLAEPVWRQALDEQWWQRARPADAARAHSMAARFSGVDASAAAAAEQCRRQALQLWGIDLSAPAGPLRAQDVDPGLLEATAPAIAGEGSADWPARLDASAEATGPRSQEAPASPDDPGPRERVEPAPARSAISQVLSDHPGVDAVDARLDESGGLVLDARTASGAPVPAATADLARVVERATSPAAMARALAGTVWQADELAAKASTGLLRAASAPAPRDGDASAGRDEGPHPGEAVGLDAVRAGARARTDKESAEARQALAASGGAPTASARAEAADAIRARADEAAWDSAAAREQWAAARLEAGDPPDAVRAATTGQAVMHEPVSKATAPSAPGGGVKRGAAPGRARSMARAHRRRL